MSSWTPPVVLREERAIAKRERFEEQHRAAYRQWLRRPCARTYLDPNSGEPVPLNRHPHSKSDIRFYEAARLELDVFNATPEALTITLWFFALSDELRQHLCRTLVD